MSCSNNINTQNRNTLEIIAQLAWSTGKSFVNLFLSIFCCEGTPLENPSMKNHEVTFKKKDEKKVETTKKELELSEAQDLINNSPNLNGLSLRSIATSNAAKNVQQFLEDIKNYKDENKEQLVKNFLNNIPESVLTNAKEDEKKATEFVNKAGDIKFFGPSAITKEREIRGRAKELEKQLPKLIRAIADLEKQIEALKTLATKPQPQDREALRSFFEG